jgi:hypothetical protein
LVDRKAKVKDDSAVERKPAPGDRRGNKLLAAAEPGEEAAFTLEAFLSGAPDQRCIRQLDRGAAGEPAVVAADERDQDVRAERLTGERALPYRSGWSAL